MMTPLAHGNGAPPPVTHIDWAGAPTAWPLYRLQTFGRYPPPDRLSRVKNKMNDDENMKPNSRPPRQQTLLRGLLRPENRPNPIEIRVRNLSSGGLMANCTTTIERGERVLVTLRGVGEVPGMVVWNGADAIGVAFDEPIDPHLAFQPTKAPQPERYVPEVERETRRPGLRIR